jgi:hypothetical protein
MRLNLNFELTARIHVPAYTMVVQYPQSSELIHAESHQFQMRNGGEVYPPFNLSLFEQENIESDMAVCFIVKELVFMANPSLTQQCISLANSQ